jgi:ArsR family transcriptional regulator, arsenate/arsenite/antimonite-responsive transcriptional repressor / arsenate reductase (thioredoxin)
LTWRRPPEQDGAMHHAGHADLALRAQRHAALGDTHRLAIIDALHLADRSPDELARLVGVGSNLLAHHLDVLDDAGLIQRTRSGGDRRRRYVRLVRAHLPQAVSAQRLRSRAALFVCTHNAARSQLAAALWRQLTGESAHSAGTDPAPQVHPGAVAAAIRHGLDLSTARPRPLGSITRPPKLVITVCDRAHEALDPPSSWLHWSIPDPLPKAAARDFDAVVQDLRQRITGIVDPSRTQAPTPTPKADR